MSEGSRSGSCLVTLGGGWVGLLVCIGDMGPMALTERRTCQHACQERLRSMRRRRWHTLAAVVAHALASHPSYLSHPLFPSSVFSPNEERRHTVVCLASGVVWPRGRVFQSLFRRVGTRARGVASLGTDLCHAMPCLATATDGCVALFAPSKLHTVLHSAVVRHKVREGEPRGVCCLG